METTAWMEINGQLIHNGDEVQVRNADGIRLRGTWTFQWTSHSDITGKDSVTVFGGTRQQTRSFDVERIEPIKVKRGPAVHTSH